MTPFNILCNFCIIIAQKFRDLEIAETMMACMLDVPEGKARQWAQAYARADSKGAGGEASKMQIIRITWMDRNLVEGPVSGQRNDDPGVSFDNFDVPNMPQGYGSRLKAIKALDSAVRVLNWRLKTNGIAKTGNGIALHSGEAKVNTLFKDYRDVMISLTSLIRGTRVRVNEPLISFNSDI